MRNNGQGLLEYAVIIALVALIVLVLVVLIGPRVSIMIQSVMGGL